MNDQEAYWAGVAGDEYTARNRVDWRARIPFWADVMRFTGARSVYEVGCGTGWNLSAIREASPHRVGLWGCDINERAQEAAWAADLHGVQPGTLNCAPGEYELVFTAGVLIHVSSVNLPTLMTKIAAASSHYVIAIEYAVDAEEMIEYRGQPNLLWKRPYGALYEALGLKLLHTGEATGFDRCTYWLLSKP